MYRTRARCCGRAEQVAILADKIRVAVAVTYTVLLLNVIRAATFETIAIGAIGVREFSRHGEELRCREEAAVE